MEYYHGNINLPVYGHPRHGYNCEEIVHILLDPVFTDELLSTTHPVSVEHNVAFVIDLNSLSNPNDVHADDLGSWKCTGSRRLTFMVKFGPTTCHIVSSELGSGGRQVQIRRQYHVHRTGSDLHRMIAFVEEFEGIYYKNLWCVCERGKGKRARERGKGGGREGWRGRRDRHCSVLYYLHDY